jgi:chaperone modulatory protein CbpM
MPDKDLISVTEFCESHQLKYGFIESLRQYGLIQITTIEQSSFIHDNELPRLEQFTRLHQDLDINFEGMEAISHLLDQINEMHEQIIRLKNKLNLHEHGY